MDYSKYRYEQAKREKENRKNQKTVETKEIRLSLKIDIGDFNTKLNHAKKFLEAGNKLKVSIRLRGREMAHSDLGVATMQRFAEGIGELGSVDKQPKLEGRQILMFMSPRQQSKFTKRRNRLCLKSKRTAAQKALQDHQKRQGKACPRLHLPHFDQEVHQA